MVWHRRGLSGSPGSVRSSAWIWLFSSIDSTTAWAGGSTPGSGRWAGPRAGAEPDNVGQLGGKAGIARSLERAKPVRLKFVRPPDALHRAHRDADGLGHCPAGPVGRLVRWRGAEPAPAKALGHAHISESPSVRQEAEFVDAGFESYGAGRSRRWVSIPAAEASDQPGCPSQAAPRMRVLLPQCPAGVLRVQRIE